MISDVLLSILFVLVFFCEDFFFLLKNNSIFFWLLQCKLWSIEIFFYTTLCKGPVHLLAICSQQLLSLASINKFKVLGSRFWCLTLFKNASYRETWISSFCFWCHWWWHQTESETREKPIDNTCRSHFCSLAGLSLEDIFLQKRFLELYFFFSYIKSQCFRTLFCKTLGLVKQPQSVYESMLEDSLLQNIDTLDWNVLDKPRGALLQQFCHCCYIWYRAQSALSDGNCEQQLSYLSALALPAMWNAESTSWGTQRLYVAMWANQK